MKMTSTIFVLATVLAFFSLAHATVNETTRQKLLRIARKTSMAKNNRELFEEAEGLARRLLNGCKPNICFALDGSGSIGSYNYETQKEFVLLLTALLGANDETSFSAVQYGFVNEPISTFTRNAESFIDAVLDSEYQGASRTFVGAGLAQCISQLGRVRGLPAKIVLFGDGGASLGRLTGPLSPAKLADTFRSRSPANSVCAVAVNYNGKPPLFVDIVGGEDNRKLVVDVEGWPTIINQLKTLIRDICEETPIF